MATDLAVAASMGARRDCGRRSQERGTPSHLSIADQVFGNASQDLIMVLGTRWRRTIGRTTKVGRLDRAHVDQVTYRYQPPDGLGVAVRVFVPKPRVTLQTSREGE